MLSIKSYDNSHGHIPEQARPRTFAGELILRGFDNDTSSMSPPWMRQNKQKLSFSIFFLSLLQEEGGQH